MPYKGYSYSKWSRNPPLDPSVMNDGQVRYDPYDDRVYFPKPADVPRRNPLYSIPYQDRFILYAPLRRLAFTGNRAMANLAAAMLAEPERLEPATRSEARSFVESVGLLSPPLVDPTVLDGESPFTPSVVVLLLTTSCNFRCAYCYASAGDSRGELMPIECGLAAIDVACRNAQQRGESSFSLSFHGGGEPTLAWEHLTSLVQHARSQPLPVHINLASNGVWTQEKRDWIVANVDDVSLSCDGLPEVQNRQRPLASGAPSSDGVYDTIQELDARGRSYGIRLTVTEAAIDSLAPGIDYLCRETACHSFQAEPAFGHGRARAERRALLSSDRFAAAFLDAYDVAHRHGRELVYSGARPLTLTGTFCSAPQTALIVGKEGRLTACYEVFDPGVDLGDQLFFGSIAGDGALTVNHARRRAFLNKIRERRALCRGCFCYYHCAGDCPAKTLTPDGQGHTLFGPRCEVNRAVMKGLLARLICEADGVWQGQQHPTSVLNSPNHFSR